MAKSLLLGSGDSSGRCRISFLCSEICEKETRFIPRTIF
jgi:hypothetical protein